MKKKGNNSIELPYRTILYKYSKRNFSTSLFVFFIGISLLISTPFVDNLIQSKIDGAIVEVITVPDPKDDAYDEWVCSKESSIPSYQNFYMWNLTNQQEFLTGKKPILKQIGPYIFQEFATKYDIAFSDDKELVAYNSYTSYEFEESFSTPLRLTDKITNINPGYLGILELVNTERNLTESGTPAVLLEVQNVFDEIFNEEKQTFLNDEALETLISEQIDPENFTMLCKYGFFEEIKNYIKKCVPPSNEVFISEWNTGMPIITIPDQHLFENDTKTARKAASLVYSEVKKTFEQLFSEKVSASNITFWNYIYNYIRAFIVEYIEDMDEADERVTIDVNDDFNAPQITNTAVEVKNRLKDILNQPGFSTKAFYSWWGEGSFAPIEEYQFAGIRMEIKGLVKTIITVYMTVFDDNLPTDVIIEGILGEGNKILQNIKINNPTMQEITLLSRGGKIDVIDFFEDQLGNRVRSYNLNKYIFDGIWNENDPYSLIGGNLTYWIDAIEGNPKSRQFLRDRYLFMTHYEEDFNLPYDSYLDVILDWIQYSSETWVKTRVYPEFYKLNQQFESFIQQSVYNSLDEAIYDLDIDRIYLENKTGIDFGSNNDLYCGSFISNLIAKNLWDQKNEYSLTSSKGISRWYLATQWDIETLDILKYAFSLNDTQINAICTWLNLSRNSWIENILFDVIKNLNSGLITTRTVEEWLFTAKDNFIKDVQPEKANVNIFQNHKNDTEARNKGTNRLTIKTGKGNYKETKEIVAFNGNDHYLIWTKPIAVEGTDGTQFTPGVNKNEDLEINIVDFMRTAEFSFQKKVTIYGINLFRFRFSEKTFEPNPIFLMNTKGLINMYPEYDIPIYISHPHFLYADDYLIKCIIGLSPDKEYHETYIDVEPITGITMRAHQRIQINFKVTSTDQWYTNFTDVVMPILWFDKEAQISEEKANEFKSSLYDALNLKKVIIFSIMSTGTIITIVGITFFSYHLNKYKKIKIRRLSLKYWIFNSEFKY